MTKTKSLVFWRYGANGTNSKKYKDKERFDQNFHSPPQKRGLYVCPPKLVEWFLITWKGEDNMDKKVIVYNKPFLWVHHIEEAIKLGVQIYAYKGSWIKIKTEDYKRVLKKAISNKVKSCIKDFDFKCSIGQRHYHGKNIKTFAYLDEFEVFIL